VSAGAAPKTNRIIMEVVRASASKWLETCS
jgi:hypothetical protein